MFRGRLATLIVLAGGVRLRKCGAASRAVPVLVHDANDATPALGIQALRQN